MVALVKSRKYISEKKSISTLIGVGRDPYAFLLLALQNMRQLKFCRTWNSKQTDRWAPLVYLCKYHKNISEFRKWCKHQRVHPDSIIGVDVALLRRQKLDATSTVEISMSIQQVWLTPQEDIGKRPRNGTGENFGASLTLYHRSRKAAAGRTRGRKKSWPRWRPIN